MKSKNSFFSFILVSLFPLFSFSQITLTNTAEVTKIKQGTTYFAMKDPASPAAAGYVAAIKKAWTLGKVECIKYTEVEKNIAPNNSFVTIGANMTTSNSALASTETRIYLELWTTNGKYTYDPKKRRHFNQQDKIVVATVELFADFFAQNNPSALYKMDYDAAGHFKNWGTGVLSNYIQQLCTLLEKGTECAAKTEIANTGELQKLASATLFIPDYVMIKFPKNADDESKKYTDKEIFDDFTQAYKVLPTAELNDKILTNATPFYYLLFIKTPTEKFVTVTNSQTGEIIYSAYTGSATNFKSSDLKELQKATLKK
ncbi:hypothetical protein HKT18_01740 [Flavobacterium sp. IMCC34852]|uniref:Uncharacterized protein n=1 Tax=Flavobacterium rivulicola TaxID=2732161 RepID=A0A7Y3R7E5_9FLAO|nr:hypothetical protein [Flavobacterium sp. IMCC34852]NNT70926.1 hypothetical protein [Flavobacterium sp. IMCC34852]